MAIAKLTRATMRTQVRDDVWDNAATPSLSDAQVNTELNRALFAFTDMFPDDVQLIAQLGTVAFAVGNKSIVTAIAGIDWRNVTFVENGVDGIPMTRMPFNAIKRLQNDKPTQGAPTQYCLVGNNSYGSVGFYVHPIPDGNYTLNLWGVAEPFSLAGDSSTTPFSVQSDYIIQRMASVQCAMKLGRHGIPNFIEDLRADLADQLAAYKSTQDRNVRPRAAEGQGVA